MILESMEYFWLQCIAWFHRDLAVVFGLHHNIGFFTRFLYFFCSIAHGGVLVGRRRRGVLLLDCSGAYWYDKPSMLDYSGLRVVTSSNRILASLAMWTFRLHRSRCCGAWRVLFLFLPGWKSIFGTSWAGATWKSFARCRCGDWAKKSCCFPLLILEIIEWILIMKCLGLLPMDYLLDYFLWTI